MKKKLNEAQELVIHVLLDSPDVNPNGDITEEKVGNLLGVCQATVSNAKHRAQNRLREERDKQRIRELERRVAELDGTYDDKGIHRIA